MNTAAPPPHAHADGPATDLTAVAAAAPAPPVMTSTSMAPTAATPSAMPPTSPYQWPSSSSAGSGMHLHYPYGFPPHFYQQPQPQAPAVQPIHLGAPPSPSPSHGYPTYPFHPQQSSHVSTRPTSAPSPAGKPWEIPGIRGAATRKEFGPASDTCGICWSKVSDQHMLLPCSHMPFCVKCVKSTARGAGGFRCPICRRVPEDIIPIVRVKALA